MGLASLTKEKTSVGVDAVIFSDPFLENLGPAKRWKTPVPSCANPRLSVMQSISLASGTISMSSFACLCCPSPVLFSSYLSSAQYSSSHLFHLPATNHSLFTTPWVQSTTILAPIADLFILDNAEGCHL